MKKYDIAIIGGGIVGLSAAVYCGRLNLNSILIGKEIKGTIAKTHIVENYPGFKKISGEALSTKVLDHAKQYKTKIFTGEVIKISYNKCFIIKTKKATYSASAILCTQGSEWRKLNVPGEKKFTNKGVHYCALCDGPLYKNKILAVAGGGDSAAKEALLLATYAKKVYVLSRSTLKPEPINKIRVQKEKKIQVLEGIQVKEIKGSKFVESISLTKKVNNSNELKVDGIFIDVGHVPLSKLTVPIGVKLNKNKEIIINKESKTNIKGVYAAGDITDTKFKQAITGVGEAVKAVYSIYEDIHKEKILCNTIQEE